VYHSFANCCQYLREKVDFSFAILSAVSIALLRTFRSALDSKLYLLVDKQGAPLSILVSAAHSHDRWRVHELVFSLVIERPTSEQHLCADKAYASADIHTFLMLQHDQPHIKSDDGGIHR